MIAKLRPLWVVKPTPKDRDTCLCQIHENGQLLADRLYFLGLVTNKCRNVEDLAGSVCCDINSRACAYGECSMCKEHSVNNCIMKDYDEQASTSWYKWQLEEKQYVKPGQEKIQTAKHVVKALCNRTIKDLIEKLDSYLKQKLCKHVFNMRHQFRAARTLKSTLADNEAIIHIDFSENYQCGYAREVQSAHFGAAKAQVTLHTGVMYTSRHSISFSSISDNRRHDAHAIWAQLTPVLAYLRNDIDSSITCLHFESGSPSGQYRNRSNAYLMSTIPFDMGYINISWNYYEAGHGKGAHDGVG